MASISKIKINETMIEEKNGKLYINGRDIDTGKYRGIDISFAMGVIR